MNENKNTMVLNGVNIGISKITLDETELIIIDKSGIYCLRIILYYNWKEINNIEIGEKAKIDFNEYILSENNEPSLIWPEESYVEKVTNNSLYFYFNFENMSKTITYMNKRNCFNILPNSLVVKAFIDYKEVFNGPNIN